MLERKEILELFHELNEALSQEGEVGEVGIVGGAVMCLVYNARKATKDVDAIFRPAPAIRKLAGQIGERRGLGRDWLNDAAKAYVQGRFRQEDVLNLSHLRVWAPEARYMLAMKCLSARWDSHDQDDVAFLIRHLKLKKPAQVFKILESYYPKKRIPPKTQFFIEELISS